ncbi:MAG: hypothetical protein ACI9YB_003062 [Halioglobus sp.]|jgi:hypothetical protein
MKKQRLKTLIILLLISFLFSNCRNNPIIVKTQKLENKKIHSTMEISMDRLKAGQIMEQYDEDNNVNYQVQIRKETLHLKSIHLYQKTTNQVQTPKQNSNNQSLIIVILVLLLLLTLVHFLRKK